MARWNVLITAPRAMPVMARYREELERSGCAVSVEIPVERLDEDQLLPLVPQLDGIICGDDRITRRVLDAAPRLRVISKWGTGIDSIDLDEAARRGIVVCNTPGAFSDPVADTVLGYVLLFARRFDLMADDMRHGLWRRLPLMALSDGTLGVIGLGACGRAVAGRAAAFGMRILAYDVNAVDKKLPEHVQVERVPLERVLSESDFVTLHATLRSDNRHLIDGARLAMMKPTAVLINTARGGLIDERALVEALRRHTIAGAALDVFEEEPLPIDSPLRSLPNVYLAPHNANASMSAAERVHATTIRNLLQALGASSRS